MYICTYVCIYIYICLAARAPGSAGSAGSTGRCWAPGLDPAVSVRFAPTNSYT